MDSSGNVYISGNGSDNAFQITAGGTITEIIDATGDGAGNTLDSLDGVAVDASGNVYVAANLSDNAFQITPGGTITQIIDATGDGVGNTLDFPAGVAVDASGNVYVAGRDSDNVFRISEAPPVPSLSPLAIALLVALMGAAGIRNGLRAQSSRREKLDNTA